MRSLASLHLLRSLRPLRLLAASLLGAALLAPLAPACAQAGGYPDKPIRMVLGFAPGGPTDIVARLLGQKMSEQLGQAVVIDNRPGAGGNIAAEAVAKAAPDGYTLMYNTSSIAISPWVFAKVGFDPMKDFVPVVMTADSPLVLLVNPGVDASTPAQLIARVRANPKKFNYGSSGIGTIEHLTSAQFASIHGLDAAHIPYKGTAPALIDLIAGQTAFQMTPLSTAIPYVRDGRLRALGVTSRERARALPEVPTIGEAMHSGFVSSAWHGIVAPAGTPKAVIDRLNAVINAALKDPAVVHKLNDQGIETVGGSADQYGQFLAAELARWQSVVKQTGARAD